MADVELIEVGPRDGLQNEAAILPAADKVRLVERSGTTSAAAARTTATWSPPSAPATPPGPSR